MRNSDHETRFCSGIGGGLRRRIYSWLCPRRRWTWWRLCPRWWRRLRAQSYASPWITSTADARVRKPDSGPARGTFAAARHQRAGGAEPGWRCDVGGPQALHPPAPLQPFKRPDPPACTTTGRDLPRRARARTRHDQLTNEALAAAITGAPRRQIRLLAASRRAIRS
jgi:hypothetical protein